MNKKKNYKLIIILVICITICIIYYFLVNYSDKNDGTAFLYTKYCSTYDNDCGYVLTNKYIDDYVALPYIMGNVHVKSCNRYLQLSTEKYVTVVLFENINDANSIKKKEENFSDIYIKQIGSVMVITTSYSAYLKVK